MQLNKKSQPQCRTVESQEDGGCPWIKGASGRPAVFLDRDGTINEQMGYINHLSRFVLLPGAAPAIGRLNRAGYLAIVVSNQSGVARGYFPLKLVEDVHRHMRVLLAAEGASLDAVYYCPHHPAGKVAGFNQACDCRKPRTGMIEQARAAFAIDMTRSWVVGDRLDDMEMARRAGLPGILVTTGYGRGEVEYLLSRASLRPDYIARDLPGAVGYILGDEKGGGL